MLMLMNIYKLIFAAALFIGIPIIYNYSIRNEPTPSDQSESAVLWLIHKFGVFWCSA